MAGNGQNRTKEHKGEISVNFSQFAQMLYPFLSNGAKEAQFVLTLIDNIMETPDGENNDEYNPLSSYEENSLRKFYKGSSIFSHSNAKKILNRLDAANFETYLSNNLTASAQTYLVKSLSNFSIKANERDLSEKCTDTFIAILEEIVTRTKRQKSESAATSSDTADPKDFPHLQNYKTLIKKFHNKNFLPDSRDTEINIMQDTFKSGKYNIVILSGFGGIGKSELAKHYAYINQDSYDYICLLEYKYSLQATINSKLIIENFETDHREDEEQSYQRKLEFLKNNDSKTLIIIDNFDIYVKTVDGKELFVPAIEDNHFREFVDTLSCHVIFTSRVVIEKIDNYPSQLKGIEINQLDNEYCMKLFNKHYQNPLNEIEQKDILKLIEDIKGNTLLIILLANILREHREITPSDNIAEQFSKIRGIATQIRREKSFHENLSSIFDLSIVSDHKKYILGSLSFFPNTGIERSLFGKWIDITKDYTDLNQLISTNWIMENAGKIYMHPAVREIVTVKLVLDLKKHKKLTDSFIESVRNYELNGDEINLLTADVGKNLCRCIDETENRNTIENSDIYMAAGDIHFNMGQHQESLDFYIKAEKLLSFLNEYNEKIYDKIYSVSIHIPPNQSDKLSSVLTNEYNILTERIPLYLQRLTYIMPKFPDSYSSNDKHEQTLLKLQEAFDIIQQFTSE